MNENKCCFIITPIGSNESSIRRATEGLIEAVIIPALIEVGFEVSNISVAHRISESGSINRQIIKKIIEDDLAIVNLTGLNPNVMYELAVRHAIAKPLVMLAEEGTNLPFDIVDQRTIFYKNDMLGAVQLKDDLINFVQSSIANTKVENPLINMIQENNALSNVTSIGKSAVELIIDRLDRLENNVSIKDANKRHSNLVIKFSFNKISKLTVQEKNQIKNALGVELFNSSLMDFIEKYKVILTDDDQILVNANIEKPISTTMVEELVKDIVDNENIILTGIVIR